MNPELKTVMVVAGIIYFSSLAGWWVCRHWRAALAALAAVPLTFLLWHMPVGAAIIVAAIIMAVVLRRTAAPLTVEVHVAVEAQAAAPAGALYSPLGDPVWVEHRPRFLEAHELQRPPRQTRAATGPL
jgi:predicted cation transporter